MASSLSSFSSYSRNWIYDVFPSFSGEDIRHNFLSHFLRELDRKAIISFRDNNIKKGDSLDPALKNAILDSRIAVVVFTEKYASSSWCLNELLEIVKCKKENGQLVIPVFLRLDPSHVRKQTGEFGEIFKNTCKNVTKEVINQWQKALTDVANIVGYDSHKCESEAKLIGNIIGDIQRRLNRTPSKDFGGHFVGNEDHIANITSLLCMGSEDVRTVGIWGPSGVGKSTIARVLFRRLSRNFHFHNSLFIDNAYVSRNMSSYVKPHRHDELFFLLKCILFDLSAEDDREYMLANKWGLSTLHHRKVLIFFDCLDWDLPIDALDMGKKYWIGSGSRIIAITKDKHILKANGVDCIYEVGPPSEELAVEMLCQSAFGRSSPPPNFEVLAVEIASYASSLPLCLSVLGSSLRGKGKAYWAEILQRLEEGVGGKIEKTLRVSYDALGSEDDKKIFRHIACLFNLEKVNDLRLLLADRDLDIESFDVGLKNLVAKSLVHVRLGIVEMHPLLQKLGQAIVREQSKSPGEREFLMDSKDICHVLEDKTGTHKVLGLRLNVDEIDELDIHEKAFKKLSNLHFLKILSDKSMFNEKPRLRLPINFDHLPHKLKLLCWDGYPMKSMPPNFRPEKLVIFKMQDSKLEKLWEGSKELPCLKEINLWGSENLKEIPDLSRATILEKLYTGYRLRWLHRPSSIRNFNKLTTSGMLECRDLETPSTNINLESPRHFIPTKRSNFHLENIPGGMKPLIRMVTTLGSSILKNLRDGVQPLIRMVTTRGSSILENLWDGMQPLIHIRMARSLPASLTVLFLTDIPNMVELPFSIHNLNKLTDLTITQCKNLKTLPTGINLESLECLHLYGCSQLMTFPDISRNISSLYLAETAIEEVPSWVEKFSKLKYLIMQRCSKLKYVHVNMYKLEHLKFVNFSHCGALTGWNGYPTSLANIEKEFLVSMEGSSSLPDNYLGKVDVSFINCSNLDQEALFQHSAFQKLTLSGEELPSHFALKTRGPSMAFPLLQTPRFPPVFRFWVCAVVVFNSEPTFGTIGIRIKVICRFKSRFGNHIDSHCHQESFWVYQNGSHLLSLGCHFPLEKEDAPQAEVNYDYVDIQFHKSNSKIKLKEWGIRLSEDYSSAQNRLANPNTLLQICEAKEDNNVNDGYHETKYGETREETLRDSRKKSVETIVTVKATRQPIPQLVKKSVETAQHPIKLLCKKELEAEVAPRRSNRPHKLNSKYLKLKKS